MEAADFTALTSDILRSGNSIRFTACGSSMLPWIKDGDMLTIQPRTENEIRVGQVVFYPSAGDRPVVHRVIRIQLKGSQSMIVTRGDASPKSEEHVKLEEVLGVVVRIHRGSKVIHLERNLWWRLSRSWPAILRFTHIMVRFQRRFQRYIVLSPKGKNLEPGE